MDGKEMSRTIHNTDTVGTPLAEARTPVVSVIIPAYNTSESIAGSHGSVFAQGHQDLTGKEARLG